MGLLEFGILCAVTLGLAFLIVWILGQVAPGHPGIVDKIIWIVAVVIILVALFNATGIMRHDPQIPHV